MDIKKILTNNGISFNEDIKGEFIIYCPICQTTIPYNIDTPAELHINKTTGNSLCYRCKIDISFEELVEKAKWDFEEKDEIQHQKSNTKRIIRESHLWSVPEILKTNFGKQEWIVEHLIPIQGVTMLSGNPQSFKTWLTIEIAKNVALGTPFVGKFKTSQGSVLVINEEDHIRYLQKRIETLGIPSETSIHFLSQEGIKIDNNDCLSQITSIIKEKNIKFVILDAFVRIHTGKENDANDIAYVFERIKELTKMGITVLITHHHRKDGYGPHTPSESIRGSSDIFAALDCHISLERKEDRIFVRQNKLKSDELLKPFNITVVWSPDRKLMRLDYDGEVEEPRAKKEEAKNIIAGILSEGETTREEINKKVRIVTPIGISSIGEALKEMRGEGMIYERTEAKNKKFYSLSPP